MSIRPSATGRSLASPPGRSSVTHDPDRIPAPLVLAVGVVCGFLSLVFQLPTPVVTWCIAAGVLYNGFEINVRMTPDTVCKEGVEALGQGYIQQVRVPVPVPVPVPTPVK
jgi:hypothetical protein